MEFYFNVSRNKCSFSFQSDVFVQGIVLFPSVSCKYFAHCFFSFPLFVSFISYAFSSLFEYCDRIKHIACFLLCLISKLLSTSVCSSLYLFLALESSALFLLFFLMLADCQFNTPRTVQTIPFDYCISVSFNRFFLVLP